jgi:hypothetical protein
MAHEKFRAKAPQIMRDLIRDLRIGTADAAAINGNFGVETGGFTLRLEKGKTTFDTTGFGWAQWTGSRRHDFVRWMKANGFDDVANDPAGAPEPRYDAACYGFLIYELTQTWEKRVLPALKGAQGLAEKTRTFMKLYERPGVPHESRRIEMAEIALEEFGEGTAPTPTPAPKPPAAVASGVVPADWMMPAKMARIIVHWTAGGHRASSVDLQHYHVLVEGDGTVKRGTKTIKDNESTDDNVYAAHTLGTNTGSIGVSMCAMMDAVENPFDPGPAPLTKTQWDKMVQVCAVLARTYGIAVTPKTILTHAEVQPNLGIKQKGKWDVTRLAFDRSVVGAKACGDRMRAEVRAAMEGRAPPVPRPSTPPAKPDAQKTIVAAILAFFAGVLAWIGEHPVAVTLVLAGLGVVGFFAWRWWKGRKGS